MPGHRLQSTSRGTHAASTSLGIALVWLATSLALAQERKKGGSSTPAEKPRAAAKGWPPARPTADLRDFEPIKVRPDARRALTDFDDPDAPGEANVEAPRRTVEDFRNELFDARVYKAAGAIQVDETIRSWRSEFRLILSLRVENDTRKHRLTSAQVEKLRLAGKGDIKRFFDWLEVKRKEFAVRDAATVAEFFGELNQVVTLTRQSGPFGDGSLYAKVVNKIEHDRRMEAEEAVVLPEVGR